MAYSYVRYTGDGILDTFTIPFPYLHTAHITVRVDGVVTPFTFVTDSTIQISPAPANGKTVEIRRNSVLAQSIVDYVDGSTLSEKDLDTAALQALFLAQESVDYAEELSVRVDGLAIGGLPPIASNISYLPTGGITSSNVQNAISELDNKKLALTGGTLTGPLQLAADPAGPLQPVTLQFLQPIKVFPGFIRPGFEPVAPAGWLILEGGTIGNGNSGATVRANADCAELFAYLWNNLGNSLAPVSGGRGASAADDFAADKTIVLPDWRNRMLIGAGQSTVVEEFTDAAVSVANDTITVAANDRRWITGMPITFQILTGSITGTGITHGATLYVIRDSATTIKLASSLADAQNLTAINITAVGAGSSFRITHTFTARTVGETGGEESHAMSSNELLAHGRHGTTSQQTASNPGAATMLGNVTHGGNAAMNIMTPFYAVNWFIKL